MTSLNISIDELLLKINNSKNKTNEYLNYSFFLRYHNHNYDYYSKHKMSLRELNEFGQNLDKEYFELFGDKTNDLLDYLKEEGMISNIEPNNIESNNIETFRTQHIENNHYEEAFSYYEKEFSKGIKSKENIDPKLRHRMNISNKLEFTLNSYRDSELQWYDKEKYLMELKEKSFYEKDTTPSQNLKKIYYHILDLIKYYDFNVYHIEKNIKNFRNRNASCICGGCDVFKYYCEKNNYRFILLFSDDCDCDPGILDIRDIIEISSNRKLIGSCDLFCHNQSIIKKNNILMLFECENFEAYLYKRYDIIITIFEIINKKFNGCKLINKINNNIHLVDHIVNYFLILNNGDIIISPYEKFNNNEYCLKIIEKDELCFEVDINSLNILTGDYKYFDINTDLNKLSKSISRFQKNICIKKIMFELLRCYRIKCKREEKNVFKIINKDKIDWRYIESKFDDKVIMNFPVYSFCITVNTKTNKILVELNLVESIIDLLNDLNADIDSKINKFNSEIEFDMNNLESSLKNILFDIMNM